MGGRQPPGSSSRCPLLGCWPGSQFCEACCAPGAASAARMMPSDQAPAATTAALRTTTLSACSQLACPVSENEHTHRHHHRAQWRAFLHLCLAVSTAVTAPVSWHSSQPSTACPSSSEKPGTLWQAASRAAAAILPF